MPEAVSFFESNGVLPASNLQSSTLLAFLSNYRPIRRSEMEENIGVPPSDDVRLWTGCRPVNDGRPL
jgi:hypothetical protein